MDSVCHRDQVIMEEIPRHEDGQVCESGEDNARLQMAVFRLARDLRDLFLEMANKLDRHHKNVNIARVTGGTVATIGGVVAIGAGIAIPFTFGISVILAIVGGAVAATGAVTAGGAGIFKYIIDKTALKEAEKKWYIFCNMYVKVHHLQTEQVKNPAADGAQTAAGVGAAAGASLGLVARETLVAAGGAGSRTAATAARLAAATASVTVLVNVILLGFSLYDIIDGSLELHRGRKSPAGDIMRKLAKELDDIIDDVDDSLLTGDLLDSDLLIVGDLKVEWYY